MKIVDLSMRINNEIEPYPGDPKISILNTLEDGFNLTKLSSTMHNGTHVEVKKHMFEGKDICDYGVERFILKGVLSNNLDAFSDAIVIRMKRYLTLEEAKLIVSKNVKMVIIDWASFDEEPYLVHKYLLKHDIILVENATNLDKLEDSTNFYVVAVPLKIEAEASLTRLFAVYL